jgi:hypothetical protein
VSTDGFDRLGRTERDGEGASGETRGGQRGSLRNRDQFIQAAGSQSAANTILK